MLKPPIPPALDEKDVIKHIENATSLDSLIKDISSRGIDSPILQTETATAIEALLPENLPLEGSHLDTAIDELMQSAGQYYRKNTHPGMLSYIASSGLPTDPIGHALTAALNQNIVGFHTSPGATIIERKLVRWMCALAGLPKGSDGLVLSGGSIANITAITVAVHHAMGPEAREKGIHHGPTPIILAAESAHFSVQRAALMLGLGYASVESIPLDNEYRMDVQALTNRLQQISNDDQRQVGCIVATAGTTAMGVIDPLDEIASVCEQYNVWLHVDAAYGGAALLSSALRDRLNGIAQADSITIDLHKWCYLAFDASFLLYRDPKFARDLFQFQSDYAESRQIQASTEHTFFELSPEVSRRSRALPAYLAWRYYGLARLGRNIQYNAECVQYLAELVQMADDMEMIAKPRLSIFCFRYLPPALSEQTDLVDKLNVQIQKDLEAKGDFMLSPTKIEGRPVLRVCICNYSSRAHHMEALVLEVRRIGLALTLSPQ